jgi:hypothetical protein
VLLTCYGNVPAERAANLIGMLLGVPVSAGFVDGASERLASRLDGAGFDEAMQAALAAEPVLAADETPVNLIDPHAGLAGQDAGAPLIFRAGHLADGWVSVPCGAVFPAIDDTGSGEELEMDKITDVGEPASELERLIAELSGSGLRPAARWQPRRSCTQSC